MKKMLLVSSALTLVMTGCLVKETTHTLYLDPNGEVTWMVLERDVRSDKEKRAPRDEEEREYLDAFARGEHGVALALRRLGGDVRSTMLRAERPYTTMTEARFGSIAELAENMLAGLAIPGRVELRTEGGERHLRITLEPAHADDDVLHEELLELVLEDRESYRIVLTDGAFTAARGFRLVADGTQAVLEEIPEEEVESRGVLELGLSWSLRL